MFILFSLSSPHSFFFEVFVVLLNLVICARFSLPLFLFFFLLVRFSTGMYILDSTLATSIFSVLYFRDDWTP